MTTCDRQGGFTLIELIVVLGVLGVLLGTAVPLASAVVESERRQETRRELADVATALESFYGQYAAFPATLTDAMFVGVHLQTGVGGTTLIDAFGAGQPYLYLRDTTANTATVWSRGENGVDDGIAGEDHLVVVAGAVPGITRTYQRLRLIVEVLANHIESGGAVTGTWPSLRAAIGLGTSYDHDGFGTTFDWDAATHTLRSAGADRALGSADDITL